MVYPISEMSHGKLTDEATGRTQPLVRSIPILGFYIVTATALAFKACQGIYKRYQTRQKHNDWASSQRRLHFWLFAVLAALSLWATWYYMFAFFAHSFRNWGQTGKALSLHTQEFDLVSRLELWLQNTGLFREAWETVIETPARFWWSGQIFLWTTGWSVFLGVMARKYRIHHAWTFMLLGQIVAISFAQNLFFATVLVSQRSSTKPKGKDEDEQDSHTAWPLPIYLEVLPAVISLVSTVMVPTVAHTKYFMAILLVPHLLLFVPATFRASRNTGTRPRVQGGRKKTIQRYIAFFQIFTTVCIAIQAHSTYLALESLGTGSFNTLVHSLLNAIYEHPAVSSVSWDVIYCTVSAMAWIIVNGGSSSRMLGELSSSGEEE